MNETLIVLYPPGTGGHHLADLTALTAKFAREIDFDKYQHQRQDGLAFNVNGETDVLTLEINDQAYTDITVTQRNNVFSFHFYSLLNADWEKLKLFPNHRYLVIGFSTTEYGWVNCDGQPSASDDAAHAQRWAKHNYIGNYGSEALCDTEALYKQGILSKIFQGRFDTVEGSLLFSSHTDELLDRIEQVLETRFLSRETARNIHNVWFERICSSLPYTAPTSLFK